MHDIIQNLNEINKAIEQKIKLYNFDNYNPEVIAVSKTFDMEYIMPLVNHGHIHFGENKVQEASDKWVQTKAKNRNIKLHMIGKLQTNKVKQALKIFDYIHSVDSEKLAKKISEEQNKINKKLKVFIQVNIGNESQKSGVNKDDLEKLVVYCKDINLDLVGLMCIPPFDIDPTNYFNEMSKLNNKYSLTELSMGMSSDYLIASQNSSTFVRIGSSIFGQRF